jgi:hypothetical protein
MEMTSAAIAIFRTLGLLACSVMTHKAQAPVAARNRLPMPLDDGRRWHRETALAKVVEQIPGQPDPSDDIDWDLLLLLARVEASLIWPDQDQPDGPPGQHEGGN